MRNAFLLLPLLFLAGCSLAGNIFQAGVITTLMMVLLVVAVLFFVAKKFRGGKKDTGER